MKNIVKDIQENCKDCECNVENTVKFLQKRGDIHLTSDHYREVWSFYKKALEMLKNKKKARETTLELYKIKPDKFKYIQKWARVVSFT